MSRSNAKSGSKKKQHRSGPDDDGALDRSFEGSKVTQELLALSGALGDVDDVVGAFKQAHAQKVPANIVIQALWADEPRFESPDEARRLFSNLLALYDLVGEGHDISMASSAQPVRVKAKKAERPEPFEGDAIDESYVHAATRFLEDAPKERERLQHAFDNRHDQLISALEEKGLSDDAFSLALTVLSDVFAVLELGGRTVESSKTAALFGSAGDVPSALRVLIEERVHEAVEHETHPLPDAEAASTEQLILEASAALWKKR